MIRFEDFERTLCDCAKCADCCEHGSGAIAPNQLADFRAKHGDAVLRRGVPIIYCRGSNVVDSRGRRALVIICAPSIVVEVNEPIEWCPFFIGRRCEIHDHAPFGCAYYDPHMAPDEGDRRSTWLAEAIIADEGYMKLAESLPYRASFSDAQNAHEAIEHAPPQFRALLSETLMPLLLAAYRRACERDERKKGQGKETS